MPNIQVQVCAFHFTQAVYQHPHVLFYMLIMLLHNEARLVHIQVRLVSESKLKRHQEKSGTPKENI